MVFEVNRDSYSGKGDRITYDRVSFPAYLTIFHSSVHKMFLHLLTALDTTMKLSLESKLKYYFLSINSELFPHMFQSEMPLLAQ